MEIRSLAGEGADIWISGRTLHRDLDGPAIGDGPEEDDGPYGMKGKEAEPTCIMNGLLLGVVALLRDYVGGSKR